jgi:FkbM family methyltransferase
MIDQYIQQVRKFSSLRPSVCVEIGALDGEYSCALAAEFGLPAQNLYLVEPNPSLLPGLAAAFPGSPILPFAISGQEGPAQLRAVRAEERAKIGCSSLMNRVDGWAERLDRVPVDVQCITGRSLAQRIGSPIDLCIIDVEGLSHEVLESFGDSLGHVRSLMIECEHEELFAGQKLFPDVAALLERAGFRMMAFQFSYANQSDSVWIHECVTDLKFRHGR